MATRLDEQTYHYFDCIVRVWHIPFDAYWGLYPWRYEVEYNNRTVVYMGVPNFCSTRRAALKRAWWRCKWRAEGTYDQHYS